MIKLIMSEEQVAFLFELVDLYLKTNGVVGLEKGVMMFNALNSNLQRNKNEKRTQEKLQHGEQPGLPLEQGIVDEESENEVS